MIIRAYHYKTKEDILIDDLSITNIAPYSIRIIYECDRCGREFETNWREIKRGSREKNQICKTCRLKTRDFTLLNTKRKETCLKKYGCEHPIQNKEIYKKREKTYLKRYGTSNPLKDGIFEKKREETCLRKYGVKNPLESKDIRQKCKATCLEKYGVDNPLLNEKICNKAKSTNREKLGVDYPFQNNEVLEKIRNNNLEKYGVKTPAERTEVQEKIRNTVNERYGVDCIFEIKEIRDKAIQTKINKYGTAAIGVINAAKTPNKFESRVYSLLKSLFNNIYYCQKSKDKDIEGRPWFRKLGDNKTHIPDFKLKGENRVIECHGVYWHRDELYNRGQTLIDLYKDNGIDCLIIWEDNFIKDPNQSIKVIKEAWL